MFQITCTLNLVVRYIKETIDYSEAIIISPDAGGAKRAAGLADRLDLNLWYFG